LTYEECLSVLPGSDTVFEVRNWARFFGSNIPRTQRLEVSAGALFSMDTDDLADGSKKQNGACPAHCATPSHVSVQDVLIDARVRAPSLMMDAFMMTVTTNGLVNMDYGGQKSDCGEGACCHSCLAELITYHC